MNGSHRETMRRVVVSANVLAAVLSGVAAVLARRNPALLVGGRVTPMVTFYVEAYLARQLPLSAVLLGLLATSGTPGLRPVLLLAGLAQAGDAAVGARHARPGMILGSTVGAVIHLGSAVLLGRAVHRYHILEQYFTIAYRDIAQ